MYNDDFDKENEKEEESLIKEMAKKAISKKIKTTSSFNFVILFVVNGIVLFLLLITVISSVSIMFFFNDDDSSSAKNDYNLVYVGINSEDNFWWPIGGTEIDKRDGNEYADGEPTSKVITSQFANRQLAGSTEYHNGIDIGSSGRNTDYIISVYKGTVHYANDTCSNNGSLDSICGGGFGNYIIIKHPGDIYTIYAHLYPGSVRVKAGDVVEQGQVIGEMGNSGRSTGKHLHFQIEVGARNNNNAINPSLYVSESYPRPQTVTSSNNTTDTSKSEIMKMLHSWEGTGPTEGNYYIVYDDGYGTLTVGHGVTLKWNKDRFKKRNIDTSSLGEGSKIEKSIVDDIEEEIFNEYKNSVLKMLSKNNITLDNYQIEALVMRRYNTGNVGGFPDKYIEYGNTESLYDNYMKDPTTSNGKYSSGLVRRREAEWNLFHNGIYTFNS